MIRETTPKRVDLERSERTQLAHHFAGLLKKSDDFFACVRVADSSDELKKFVTIFECPPRGMHVTSYAHLVQGLSPVPRAGEKEALKMMNTMLYHLTIPACLYPTIMSVLRLLIAERITSSPHPLYEAMHTQVEGVFEAVYVPLFVTSQDPKGEEERKLYVTSQDPKGEEERKLYVLRFRQRLLD